MATNRTVEYVINAVDRASKVFNQVGDSAQKLSKTTKDSMSSITKSFKDTGASFAILGASAGLAFTSIMKTGIEFEDRMADIAKTTGLAGQPLKDLERDILNLGKTTRSSVSDLLSIGEIGGQLGVAEKDMVGFIKAMDIVNVAIGKDFAGGVEEVTASFGKISTLFSEVSDLPIDEAILRITSGVNDLGAKGSATSENIVKFTQKLGALAPSIRPGLEATMALASVLEESGLNADIAAGGVTQFFTSASGNMGEFAKVLGMTKTEAQALFDTKPEEFLMQFSKILSQMSPEELNNALKNTKLNTQEVLKVVGALGGKTDRFAELLDIVTSAVKNNTSAVDEYKIKNTTAAAEIGKLQNNVFILSKTLSDNLMGAIEPVTTFLSGLIQKFIEFAEKYPQLTSAIILLTGAFAGLVAGIGGFLLLKPALTAIFSVFTSSIGLIIFAVLALIIIGWWLYKNWDEIKLGFQILWNEMAEAFWTWVADVQEGIKIFIDEMKQKWEALKVSVLEKFNSMWQSLVASFWNFVANFQAGVENLKANIIAKWEAFKTSTMNVFNALFTIIKSIWEKIKTAITSATSTMVSTTLSNFNKLKSTILSVINAISGAWNKLASLLKKGIQGTIKIFKSSSDKGKGSGGKKKALGGLVRSGESYTVGERGQETFVPNESGTILPTQSSSGGNTFNFDFSGANIVDREAFIEEIKKAISRDDELANFGIV